MATRNRQAVRSGQQGWPGWVWLCIGVVLGLILSAVVLIGDWAPSLRSHDLPTPQPNASAPAPAEPGVADADNTSDYDFYSVLPEMEVLIPDAELSAKARAEATRTEEPSAAKTGGGYLLQAGSFPNAADADAVKARLALLGFRAHIQPVTINGKTWNRVRLGPYNSAATLEEAKQKLAANGINAIALKEQ